MEYETSDELTTMPTGWGDIEVSRYRRLRDYVALRLLGTDFEWGQLNLPVPMSEEEAEEWLPGAPDSLKQGGFHVHEVGLVMEPTRGMLVVGDVGGDEADEEVIERRVMEEYARVSEEEHLIRERIDSRAGRGSNEGFWSKYELPIGTALLLRGAAADWDPKGTGLDPAILVDATDWHALPERLDEALAFYVRAVDQANSPPTDADTARNIAPYLVNAVKGINHQMGGFMDHISFLSGMDEVMGQL